MSNKQQTAAPLEGKERITPEGTESTTVPEPKIIGGKLQCPVCNRLFDSKKQYDTHEHQEHKVGTSTSTAIY